MKISAKIFATLLVTSQLVLLLAGAIFYTSERSILQTQIYNQLQSIGSLQHKRLESIIEQNTERLALVSSRTQLRISLNNYSLAKEPEKNLQKMQLIIQDAKSSIPSFYDIHILSLKGELLTSTSATSVEMSYFDDKLLRRSYTENSADTLFIDKQGELRLLLAGPLIMNDRAIGIIIIESDTKNLIDSVHNYTGLGETGEVIVAKMSAADDVVFLFPSRFDPDAALNRIVASDDFDSPFVQALAHGKDVIADGIDYRGHAVLAVSRYITALNWTVLVKIDQQEAFAPIDKTWNRVIVVSLILGLVAAVVAYIVAKSITSPIVYLTEMTKTISSQGLGVHIEKRTNDEVGVLTDAFNDMVHIRHQVATEREQLVAELQQALSEVKELRGILPICAVCKKIRNDDGYFEQIEAYIQKHSEALFSHTICPDCIEKEYPEFAKKHPEYLVDANKKSS